MADRGAIRRAVAQHGGIDRPIDRIGDEDDLYSLGMTSHAAVGVMLAVEDELGLEMPDELLVRATFRSIAAIDEAIDRAAGLARGPGDGAGT